MTPQVLSQIHSAAFAPARGWSELEFTKLLQQRGVILSSDVGSFVLGRVIAGEAEILTVATTPEYRGQGRATAVLVDFLAQAKTAGATRVFLEVSEINERAISLYYKQKFIKSGRRPNYYPTPNGSNVDAILMEAQL